MSDDAQVGQDTLGSSTTTQHGATTYDDQAVNDLLSYKLARQEEKLRRQFEEEAARVKSSVPNEEAIAARVKQELEQQHQAALKEQQDKMFQTQFERDKNQYKTLIQDVKVEEEQDECGFFTPEGEKKYLPLQVIAGNLNMERTPEILKELAKHPGKLTQASFAAHQGDWAAVKAMFNRIDKSLKTNERALEESSRTSQPLSHLKASSGGSSKRATTLDDYRNDPSLYF